MRAIGFFGSFIAAAALVGLSFGGGAARAQAPAAASERPPNPDELLNNIVVVSEAASGRPLPKLAVLPSLAPDIEDVTLRSVVRRDLDLCGEFEIVPDKDAPEGIYTADTPIDVKPWQAKNVEALVRVV